MLIDLRNCHVRRKWEHYLSPGAMASAPPAESYCTAQHKSPTLLKVIYHNKQVPAALSRSAFLQHPSCYLIGVLWHLLHAWLSEESFPQANSAPA